MDFQRPKEKFRFNFRGMRVTERADEMPPDKYPLAVNVRCYADTHVRTRPGLFKLGVTNNVSGAIITDMNTIAYLPANNNEGVGLANPTRVFARNRVDQIFVDSDVVGPATLVGSLLTAAGIGPGAAMIPFRPDQSPYPWMYIANGLDYQKFSCPAPSSTAVTQRKVGIAEPQASVDVVPEGQVFQQFLPSSGWTAGGTASGAAGTIRSTDTIVTSIQDPTSVATGIGRQWSLQVSPSVQYQVGEIVTFFTNAGHTLSFTGPIMDVIPPLGGTLSIAAIFYFSGTTGRCVIVLGGTGATQAFGKETARNVPVPSSGIPITAGGNPGGVGRPTPAAPSAPTPASGGGPQGSAINQAAQGLRRGAIIQFTGGTTETVFVNSVTTGPNNAICIECVTQFSHAVGETVTSFPTLVINGLTTGAIPQGTITGDSNAESFAVATGIGTLSATMNQALTALPLDYFHFSVRLDNPANVVEIRILLDVGDGSFTQNYYYYSVAPSDFVDATTGASSQSSQLAAVQETLQRQIILDAASSEGLAISDLSVSGASQWTEVWFPITGFTRVGGDQTKTIYQATKMQILINAIGTVNVAVSSITATGGSNPDIGDIGEPYRYRIRPRSSVTGAKGNPSPDMRYGALARRQAVAVLVPTTYSDPQVDTWDVFRFGGSVTEWRYVGNVSMGTNLFIDNYDDSAAGAGELLPLDDFEPWPTIDKPLNVPIGSLNNFLVGTIAVIKLGAVNNNLARYLPGNLITVQPSGIGSVSSATVLTLRERPVTTDGGTTWIFEFDECGGNEIELGINIYEPEMAFQTLPYMWGPDAAGTVFAVGDPLRPGTLYFAKNNNPDSAPDSYNIEITPPSEPLMGGIIVDGLSFVASVNGWWALYPTPDNPAQRYNFVKQPFPRGLASPYGLCTDNRSIFWWAYDGIWSSTEGSLTDEDLFTLFPHDGVQGAVYTYGTVTVNPPDPEVYAYNRIEYCNGYLYVTYQDSGGAYDTLVYDIHRKAWCVDVYPGFNAVPRVSVGASCFKAIIQRKGLADNVVQAPNKLLVSGVDTATQTGGIYWQQDNSNDDATAISAQLATFEFSGDDIRAPKQWGDVFFDCLPVASAGISLQPMSLGSPAGGALSVPNSATRLRAPYSVNGLLITDFLGILLSWTDNFSSQTTATKVYDWQPSFVVQPARDIGWVTFGSSFGLRGFMHVRQLLIAYVSTAAVFLNINAYDGQSPPTITLPSTGGVYHKATFPVGPNKGTLYTFQTSSAAQFQIFEDDSEVWVGEWGRPDSYGVFRNLGGKPIGAGPI